MPRKSSYRDWKVIKKVKRLSKRAEIPGQPPVERLYAVIRCPFCRQKMECVANRVDQLKSVVAKSHLRHCKRAPFASSETPRPEASEGKARQKKGKKL